MLHSTQSLNLRLGLALSIFVGTVFGGVMWLAHSGPSQQQPQAAQPPPATPDRQTSLPEPKTQTRSRQVVPAVSVPAQSQLSFTLEIDLTDKRERAEGLVETLRQRGINAYYTPFSRSGKIIYRVRHGIYSSRATAQAAQVAIQTQAKLSSRVVKLQ